MLVYESGKAWGNQIVQVRALPNGLRLHRCGFSVTKRVGNAVVRNRVRRLLKETVRLTPLKVGWDIVFVARPRAATANYNELNQSVEKLLAQGHLLRDKDERVGTRVN